MRKSTLVVGAYVGRRASLLGYYCITDNDEKACRACLACNQLVVCLPLCLAPDNTHTHTHARNTAIVFCNFRCICIDVFTFNVDDDDSKLVSNFGSVYLYDLRFFLFFFCSPLYTRSTLERFSWQTEQQQVASRGI